MNIVSIYTSDHSTTNKMGASKPYDLSHLTPAEITAKVTFKVRVNFNMNEGDLIIQQYEIINLNMYIVSMNDVELTLFILAYAK